MSEIGDFFKKVFSLQSGCFATSQRQWVSEEASSSFPAFMLPKACVGICRP